MTMTKMLKFALNGHLLGGVAAPSSTTMHVLYAICISLRNSKSKARAKYSPGQEINCEINLCDRHTGRQALI